MADGALNKAVFESDACAGVLFDKVLIALVVASLPAVIADGVESLRVRWSGACDVLESVVRRFSRRNTWRGCCARANRCAAPPVSSARWIRSLCCRHDVRCCFRKSMR